MTPWEAVERSCLDPERRCWSKTSDEPVFKPTNTSHETLCGEMRHWDYVYFNKNNPRSIDSVNCPVCKELIALEPT